MGLKLTKTPKATVTEQKTVSGQVVAEDTQEQEVASADLGLPADQVAEVADVPQSTGPFAHVGVEMSVTRNLGDYNSARLAVNLQIPCLPSQIDDAFTYGRKWVEQRLGELVQELDESGNADG